MSDLYLRKAQFAAELEKCLQCPTKPCEKACPTGCSPCDFIAAAKSGDMQKAAALIAAQNPLGETCGLICPDKFCRRACLRQHIDTAIKIPAVQAEIMHQARENNLLKPMETAAPNGKKIAVIGAGPAGMGATAELLKRGFAVTVFERDNAVGGALNLIPQQRLPRETVAYEWQRLAQGNLSEIRLNTKVAAYEDLLRQGYAAVIVAVGEQKRRTLGIAGEDLLLDYTKYLKNPAEYISAGNVAVIGGGAVAVDCAVTAVKQGANHTEMFVRRALSDMRITAHERDLLLANRVDISTMTRITRVEGSAADLTLYTCKTRFNAEGKLEDVPHTEVARGGFAYIISALGSMRAEEPTAKENIWYVGDFVTGGSTAVEAVASGKKTAAEIADLL